MREPRKTTNRRARKDRDPNYFLVLWLYRYKGYGLIKTWEMTPYSFSGVRNILKGVTRTEESHPRHPDGNAKARARQRGRDCYWRNPEKYREKVRARYHRYKDECPEKIQVRRDLANWRFKNDLEYRRQSVTRQERYLKTEKGKAYLERHKNTWRGRALHLIYVLELPCIRCGEIEKGLLQCDHIIPRSVGGSDEFENLQVLCRSCHKDKTEEDYRRYHWTSQINDFWF